MSVAGKWEGKMLDASGPAARVVATLEQSDSRIKGEFSVYVASARDDSCCGSSDWKLAQTAPVTGKYTERGGKVSLSYKLDVGKEPVGVSFEAKLAEADPHARRALVGSYVVHDAEQRLGFEGGACVLWLYRGKK